MAGQMILYLAVFALSLPSLIVADKGAAENFTVDLTVDNFDEAIAKNNHFVHFFAPWCVPSQYLRPLWEQLAALNNVKIEPQVIIAKVDCTQQKELCDKHEIKASPTMRFFKLGHKESVRFRGTRNMSAFTKFINEQINAVNEI